MCGVGVGGKVSAKTNRARAESPSLAGSRVVVRRRTVAPRRPIGPSSSASASAGGGMARERRVDEGAASANVSANVSARASRGSIRSTARGADPDIGGMASPRALMDDDRRRQIPPGTTATRTTTSTRESTLADETRRAECDIRGAPRGSSRAARARDSRVARSRPRSGRCCLP